MKERQYMQTINEATTSVNTVEVESETLLTLLEGVSTHVAKDKSLPALNSLHLEAAGETITAKATDRYRLIEGTIKAREGELSPCLIRLDDVKRIITLIKSHKGNVITLIRLGDTLSVSALGDALAIELGSETYPPTSDIFAKVEGEPVAVEGVAFNPVFMADYAKIAGKGAPIKLYFNGDKSPIKVRITSDTITWRALLMPMRYVD